MWTLLTNAELVKSLLRHGKQCLSAAQEGREHLRVALEGKSCRPVPAEMALNPTTAHMFLLRGLWDAHREQGSGPVSSCCVTGSHLNHWLHSIWKLCLADEELEVHHFPFPNSHMH